MTDEDLELLRKTVYRLFRHAARLNMYVNTDERPKAQVIKSELLQLKSPLETLNQIISTY